VEAGDLNILGGLETHNIGMEHTEMTKRVSKIVKDNFNLKHLMKTFIVQCYREWE
jgi:hypothetical protein